MKILLVSAIIVAIAFVLKACINTTSQSAQNTIRPQDEELPKVQKENDKLILVNNVQQNDIENALTTFCNMYNKDSFVALPRVVTISSNSFVVTFPYDTDFVTFCYVINFLKYPVDIKWQSKVTAWVTTKASDDWITDKSKNKKVMLFLAEDDNEYDNVFMTTEDNISYKLGFAAGKEKQLLSILKEPYRAPSIQIKNLEGLPFKDIK
ncbi:hypothetical protein LX99_03925 [Mucilaginibacter oryzae]|uniref:Lipoprotein n=1 Tax=Mucilaginibacter oryzae TaxID=468058 RepID=A0A316H695_9SPHI|nr:hypothetical protein [Mucilaginibacter oryzae]PWK75431.1 hypothetical protein LX99_03925 [Mucilaginibacter oryzae]